MIAPSATGYQPVPPRAQFCGPTPMMSDTIAMGTSGVLRRSAWCGGSILLFLTGLVAAAEPTVGGIELGDQLHCRVRCTTLAALVGRAKPTFAWSASDMLWVMHDGHGRPLFAVNHAYQLDGSSRPGPWVLFDADPSYVPNGLVEYTRELTPGQLLAKDRRGDKVYLITWDSREKTGTGLVGCTRQILLLCDREGVWRFIGEAPPVISGQSGPRKFATAMEYRVRWTGGKAAPIEIQATRTETTEYEGEAGRESLRTCRNYVLRGKLPGTFTREGDDYILAAGNEGINELAERVATCKTFYPQERDPHRRQKMMRAVLESISQLNPRAAHARHPDARILLPDMDQIWDVAGHAAGPRKRAGDAEQGRTVIARAR